MSFRSPFSINRLALITIFLILLGVWGQFRVFADVTAAEDPWRELMNLTDSLYDEANLVIYQESVFNTYSDPAEFTAIGRETAERLQLPEGSLNALPDGRLCYETAAPMSGGQVTMRLVALDDGVTAYLTVRWDGAVREFPQALEWRESMPERDGARWNIGIQGMVRDSLQANSGKEEVILSVQNKLQAQRIDRYEDAGSLSVSLSSPLLNEYIISGQHKIHAQAAVHQVTESGKWRLTLGFPAITMEY